jgi:chromosome segregation ATPase
VEEINNLNETLRKKNDEINFLTTCDRRQLEDHENSENSLKLLVGKLEDKIFTIQRENELELYDTIARLKSQYEENLTKAQAEWDDIRLAHNATVDALRREIGEQKKEIHLLGSENIALEGQHKQLAAEQQHSVQMLSQKIISMETERDNELKNYTTSMKQIEDDAKAKLDDLHTAIQNKNTETEILQAQIALKNGEITHLLEEISRLRDSNRQKMRKLETTNATEQNALNNEISALKKQVLELKRNLHESENALSDGEAEYQLQSELLKQELQSQREANELLQARNGFLQEWCG